MKIGHCSEAMKAVMGSMLTGVFKGAGRLVPLQTEYSRKMGGWGEFSSECGFDQKRVGNYTQLQLYITKGRKGPTGWKRRKCRGVRERGMKRERKRERYLLSVSTLKL